MTNLFLNDNRYIAMDNRQQTNASLGKSNKTETLSKIKAIFFQHFEQAVDDCCRHIDLEFGLQLGKSRERTNKDQYIKLLEYLRLVRSDIKQNYLLKVNEIFDGNYQKSTTSQREQLDFSKVSLVNDETVKENHAVMLIIRHCEQSYYEEMAALNKLLAIQQGKQVISDSQNPIFPEKLVRALVDVVNSLKLNTEGRIALYKTFEANVFAQLGFIYRELIKQCKTDGPVSLHVVEDNKRWVEPVHASPEQPSAAFELLQQKLERWRLAHFPSVYDLISITGNVFYEYSEIENALRALQLADDGPGLIAKRQPLKIKVLKKLEELSFSIDVKILARHDEDLLDLVALIFSEIERDKWLEDSVKKAVLRLEIPLAAVSLRQYSIFTNECHPVRQLLDDLIEAGMFLNADDHDDRLILERITIAIKKITGRGIELSGWKMEAYEFSNYLNKQKQCSQHIEENAKQFMINKYAAASGKKIVLKTIEKSIIGKAVPNAIGEFLNNVWFEVLLDAYTREDGQWQKSVQAMDDLITSVMPPADDNERKQILKLLPGLIAELRRGLKQISYDKAAQARFFKDLAVWHIILMDKKGKPAADSVIVQDIKIESETIVDQSSEQAGSLAEESWVEFLSESGRQWGKLLWRDAGAETMLFVGKNGAKMLETQVDELAEKLRKGLATIVNIDNRRLTERALSQLMSL